MLVLINPVTPLFPHGYLCIRKNCCTTIVKKRLVNRYFLGALIKNFPVQK